MKYRNSIKRLKRRDTSSKTCLVEQSKVCFKLSTNILSIIEKLHFDNQYHIKWGIDHLDNRLNHQMNNLMAIDHSTRDWIDDTDYMLSRKTTQFPCVSSDYQSKSDRKPWGQIQDPVFIEPFLDENQVRLSEGDSYKRGVWYFTGYPQTDHHEMAGLPNFW